jgi:two-component system response regulator
MAADPGILLVEDDGNDVTLALHAFRRAGLDVVVEVARDGEEALHFLHLDDDALPGPAPRPRVIFLDLKMPRVDGWDVLERIRQDEHTREIPVVVVSSSRRPEDVQRSYRLGANSFLMKRFDARQPGAYLVEAARYWLELNEAPPRRREG